MSFQSTPEQAAIKTSHFGFIIAPRLIETIIVNIIWFFFLISRPLHLCCFEEQ